jgi:hypothetical protein
MLIDLWESLCGYDKWIPAEAVVTSASTEQKRHLDRYGREYYTTDSADVLMWTDANGKMRRGFFRVPDGSRLYSLLGGDTIEIRYNPEQPDEFYLRELLETRVNRAVKQTLAVVVFTSIIVLLLWMKLKHISLHS